MREQFGSNSCQAIDERFHMADGSNIIRKEIAGLLSQRFGDADEIIDVQPALFCLQSRQVGGRNGDGSGHVRLAAPLRFPKMPEDAAIHEMK